MQEVIYGHNKKGYWKTETFQGQLSARRGFRNNKNQYGK